MVDAEKDGHDSYFLDFLPPFARLYLCSYRSFTPLHIVDRKSFWPLCFYFFYE